MTVAQSLIQFGDYIMPIGTKFSSQQLDSTIENTPMLGLAGEFAPPGLALGGVITLDVDLGGGGDVSPTTSQPLVTLDDVNTECNQLFARLNADYQALIIGTSPPRYVMAQKRKFKIDYLPGSGRTHHTLAIELFAQDPRWLSSTQNTHAFAAPGNATLTNAGTARSYPLITFTAGTNPSAKIQIPTGGSTPYVEIDLTYTLAAGDTLIIDCDPRNRWEGVRLKPNGATTYTPRLDLITNIVNTIGTADTFPFMDPGASLVTIGGAGAAASVAWNDAWGL